MDTRTFVSAFEFASDSPAGIEELRHLILQLAVRGHLSHRDSNDEPVSELIKRVADERERLIETKEIRRPKEYEPLSPGELPYSIPSNWVWCRTVDLIHTVNGHAFKSADWATEGLPIIRIQNLNRADAPYNYYDGEADPKFLIDPGDLLISWSGTPGTSFGAFTWQGPKGVLNQHIYKCRLFDDYRDFIRLAINSRLDVLIGDARGGVGLQHFTKGKLERLALPIPPLAEQKRIVRRVDELMALCDQLEGQVAERAGTQTALTASTLRCLSEARHADDVRDYLDLFVERVAPQLDPGPEARRAMVEIRRTILDLATRGRLTRQNPDDEPASELLMRVSEERARRLNAREIRKLEAAFSAEALPAAYDLPPGWQWTRLGELVRVVRGITFPAEAKGKSQESGRLPCLRTSNIQRSVEWHDLIYVPREYVKRADQKVAEGDIMISMANSRELVGKVALVTNVPMEASFGGFIAAIRSYADISQEFILSVLASTPIQDHFRKGANQTTNIANISIGSIHSAVIGVPPVAEQRRIAEMLNELMTICDALDEQFEAAESKRADLTASLMAHSIDRSRSWRSPLTAGERAPACEQNPHPSLSNPVTSRQS